MVVVELTVERMLCGELRSLLKSCRDDKKMDVEYTE